MSRFPHIFVLLAALAASGCTCMYRTFVEPVSDFFASGDTVVVSGEYDALWDATYTVVSRHAPIARASQKDGYLATDTRTTTVRRPGDGHAMPADVQVAVRIEARFHPVSKTSEAGQGSPMQLDLRVFEQRSAPHQNQSDRGGPVRGGPSAQEHVVGLSGTATRSRVREQMMLRDIAHELSNRLGAQD